jgi:hypothetical protein
VRKAVEKVIPKFIEYALLSNDWYKGAKLEILPKELDVRGMFSLPYIFSFSCSFLVFYYLFLSLFISLFTLIICYGYLFIVLLFSFWLTSIFLIYGAILIS